MQSSLMRLHNTKYVGYTIELLKWSHKMDLIAMSNERGEHIKWFLKSNTSFDVIKFLTK